METGRRIDLRFWQEVRKEMNNSINRWLRIIDLYCLTLRQALEDEASTANWGKCLCGDLETRIDRVGVWGCRP